MKYMRDPKDRNMSILLLFDDNMIKMARKPEKKQKENPVVRIGEGKKMKNKYKRRVNRSREGKTGTVLELSLESIAIIFKNFDSHLKICLKKV